MSAARRLLYTVPADHGGSDESLWHLQKGKKILLRKEPVHRIPPAVQTVSPVVSHGRSMYS